jgi:hypothetical protein
VIAGVGQRLLDTTAKMVIRKFFEKLMENAEQAQQAVAASSPPPPSTPTT